MRNKSIIHPDIFEKYNTKYCYKVQLTQLGLENLKNKYRTVQALPAFLHHLMKGRQTPERTLFLENPNLFLWTAERRVLIIPSQCAFKKLFIWKNTPHLVKNNDSDGLALVAWVIDPRLLGQYGWESDEIGDAESFRKFLMDKEQKNLPPDYSFFKKSSSQARITDLEQGSYPSYLATIMDLNPSHLSLLKNLKDSASRYLYQNYQVDRRKDAIEMYFHFPYPDRNTTLHLHIRVNQVRHPAERARSFTLDEIIQCLENKETMNDLILKRGGAIHKSFIDILDNVDGISIEEVPNPFYLSSPELEPRISAAKGFSCHYPLL